MSDTTPLTPVVTERYLERLWQELKDKRTELSRRGDLDAVGGNGTTAGNYGNLRITQQNYNTAKHQDEVTWLLTARLKMAQAAVIEDEHRLRAALVELAATVLGWIEDIDSE